MESIAKATDPTTACNYSTTMRLAQSPYCRLMYTRWQVGHLPGSERTSGGSTTEESVPKTTAMGEDEQRGQKLQYILHDDDQQGDRCYY
jgi:hypothetical protein